MIRFLKPRQFALTAFALIALAGALEGGAGALAVFLAFSLIATSAYQRPTCVLGATTLIVDELLDDMIEAFKAKFPALNRMGIQFTAKLLKLNQTYIAKIPSLPTASTYNAASGGYKNGANSARGLLVDVPVTVDQHPTCPLLWEHLNAIKDKTVDYSESIANTGYVLAKAMIDAIATGFTTRNFSKELVIAVADFDFDKLSTITGQANTQSMLDMGRTLIVNTDVANVLFADNRIISKEYADQMQREQGYRRAVGVGGFAEIVEWPSLPSNNGSALTGVTIEADDDTATKASHGLQTGDPIIFSSLTGGTGLSTSTRYWAIRVDANSFKVASTYANAVAGTAINVTVDASDATVTLSENLIAFAFDKRAIAGLAGIPDGVAAPQLAALGIQPTMSITPITNDDTGITMAGVGWQEPGTADVYWTPTFVWGKRLGRDGAAASTVNVLTDYAGIRIVSG